MRKKSPACFVRRCSWVVASRRLRRPQCRRSLYRRRRHVEGTPRLHHSAMCSCRVPLAPRRPPAYHQHQPHHCYQQDRTSYQPTSVLTVRFHVNLPGKRQLQLADAAASGRLAVVLIRRLCGHKTTHRTSSCEYAIKATFHYAS